MAQRFEVGEVNNLQSLTGQGADLAGMGLKAFEPMKPEVSLAKPSMDMGGMKL